MVVSEDITQGNISHHAKLLLGLSSIDQHGEVALRQIPFANLLDIQALRRWSEALLVDFGGVARYIPRTLGTYRSTCQVAALPVAVGTCEKVPPQIVYR